MGRQNSEAATPAYRFGQERMPLQWFVGKSDWDHEPLRDELVRQVGEQLGDENGVSLLSLSKPKNKSDLSRSRGLTPSRLPEPIRPSQLPEPIRAWGVSRREASRRPALEPT